MSLSAKAGAFVPECSGEAKNPSFTCDLPVETDDLDVRFYLTESQSCKDGHITEMDHLVIGADSSEVISEDQIDVKYSDKRTYFPERADDVTIILPTSIKMKSTQYNYEIAVSDQTEPDFEGAMPDQNHYLATLKKIDAQGHLVTSAPMTCFVGF
jgi:hypothetical protein